jgi:exonuclease III
MNVNGLRLDRLGGQFDTQCQVQKEVQADILCGQEHNLDSDQTQVRSILHNTVRQHWPKSRIVFGTTPISFASMYKPGGTHIISTGDITGRIKHQESDKWGRWVSQTFQGKAHISITVISAYQVVGKPTVQGSITAASQQQSLLLQNQDDTANPRIAFRRDLMLYLKSQIDRGHEILLIGDFNEPFGSDPDGMEKIAAEIQLIDLMSMRHSSTPPATYARGRTRLDYALATHHVAEALLRSGYEPFNERFHTDHRAYFMDFDTVRLFGVPIEQHTTTARRILKTSNTQQVTVYLKEKYERLLAHNVFERAEALSHIGNRHAFAERLDRDIVKASLEAEAKMKPVGEAAWSVALIRARQLVTIISKCNTMLRTGLNHTVQIQKYILLSGDVQFVAPLTHQEGNRRLRTAKKIVDEIIKTSFLRRDKERDQQIKDLEASITYGAKDQAKILRRIRKSEMLQKVFQKIRHQRNSHIRHGITRIEIPIQPGEDPRTCVEWKQIDVPTDILHHLQQRNREHFGQAHGTPFTIPPLVNDLGYRCEGAAVDEILKGTYNQQHLDPQVALLIAHMKQTEKMAALDSPATITEEEYVSKLVVWTESTTTSPSGLHLGHYKALIAKHKYSKVDNAGGEETEDSRNQTEWNHMQSRMLTLHVQMLNYALVRGYSYERWQKVTNTILFKDTDNVRIHRTRVIHIYEADYNLTLGIKWRAALYQAETLKELNIGQYGSRPYRNAVDPVLIEELQFEISRASRKMIVQTNYDAMSCYDRIIPNLAMLVSRKFGVPKAITHTNATTLEKAKYHIRTEMGVAETGYVHTNEWPIYGTGQGSGNSPMIWCFLSCLLFDCYDLQAHKATYSNPDRSEPIEIGMIGFVDDCNGQTNDFQANETDQTLPKLLHNLQENAQSWANLLGASGGALELSKCSSHLAMWQFSTRGDPVLKSIHQTIQQPIPVVDPNTGIAHNMQFLSPYEAHKTLGHYKEPAGSQQAQFRQLKKKSDSSTEFLWKCQMTHEESWAFYHACYIPSIGYPLSCSSLTYQQLDRVQRRAMTIISAKCGYNRNTKREILFGPLCYGGASFRHLYVQQGVGQVTSFIKHWRNNTVVGKLMRCAVAWTQLTAGTSWSILHNVKPALPQLESKWLASLRNFLATIQARLEVDAPGIPPIQREHDFHLMDKIMDSGQFTPMQIRRLNYCRMYLHAVTVSDITMPSGTTLDLSKRCGQRSMLSSVTTWLQVNQDRPSAEIWKLWRKANLLWSTDDGRLLQPLGRWLVPREQQRQCHYAYTYNTSMAIRNAEDEYNIYQQHHPNQPYVSNGITLKFHQLPSAAHPTNPMYNYQMDSWTHSSRPTEQYITPTQPPEATTFAEFISQLEPWEADLLQYTEITTDPIRFCNILAQGLRAVSDGSVRYNSQGAYGWSLSTAGGERVATCMGPVFGPRPQSYRAEGYGMLSFLRFLIRMAEFTSKVDPWEGIIGTDSKSVLDTLAGKDQAGETHRLGMQEPQRIIGDVVILDPLSADWDVMIEIQYALQQLPRINLQYIKGHQDRTTTVTQLPLMAQLNVEADALAAAFQDSYGDDRPTVTMTPRTKVHLHFKAGTVTSRYPEAIRREYSGDALLQYVKTRNAWTENTMRTVNWDSHGAALSNQIKRRLHFSKMVHDILPTTAYLNKQDKGKRTCPCCNHPRETRDHILRCPAPPRNRWRHKFLSSLETFCQNTHTAPVLKQLLLDSVREWMYPETDEQEYRPNPRHHPPALRQLILQQTEIGWRQMFNGRFSILWSVIQNGYLYRTQADRKGVARKLTGEKWQTYLITHIWEQWQELWKMRNESLHGKDAAAQAIAEAREVKRRLVEIYDLRGHMEPSVQDLLCTDIHQHLQKPTWATSNWLNIHTPLFRESIRRAKARAIQGVRSIRRYFNPP